jgi:lambda repressor-like predicted transcriptional regulator
VRQIQHKFCRLIRGNLPPTNLDDNSSKRSRSSHPDTLETIYTRLWLMVTPAITKTVVIQPKTVSIGRYGRTQQAAPAMSCTTLLPNDLGIN